ncbi:MAG: restriction endonuclease subunit S [Acinetobacter towneri]
MSNKNYVPLNEFILLQRGFDLPQGERIYGDVPVVASTGIAGFHNEYKVGAPGVVIGRSGTIGGGQYITQNFWPLNTTLWVKDFKGHNARYVYYLLKSIDFQRFNVGTGVPTLNRNHLSSVLVKNLEYKNEKVIAKILGDLDDKIYLNNQINQTLESIAQAIFKSWFIDFEPVRAKIAAKQEGEDPELAAMCAISGKSEAELKQMPEDDLAELQATAALFPEELVESELGEVPKGWEVNSLGNICNFTPGSAFKPEYQGQTHGEIPFIKVSDMNLNGNEIFIVKANNYIDNSLQKERKFKLHEEGATVFAKIGVALISNRRRVLTMPTIIDNNMMSASPLKGLSTPYYLYLLLKTIDFNTLVSGTALPYLNVSDLRKILIVHPTINLLNKFELIANPLLQKIKLNSVQCEGLVTLRDNLLPKLLSGEIDASVLNGEHG